MGRTDATLSSDTVWALTGVGAAVVVEAPFAAMLFTRPAAGLFGLLGAWVGAAEGEANARRHRIAVVAVSFLWTLCLGSFATLLLARPVANWLSP